MKTKVFTIDLYGYLSEDKAKIVKEYQDHNSELIDKYGDELGLEYETVDIKPDLDDLLYSPEYIIGSLPNKYKYQLISDAVRYKYMIDNPGSIFIDTDLCIFSNKGLELLARFRDNANKSGYDYLSGEINRNRLFPCNWLMVSSGRPDGIFHDLYTMLLERLETYSYESFKPENDKWKDRMENYIWTKLWGYAIPMDLDIKKFRLIPYELFQAYSWNGNWRNADVMKKDMILGCHFFGFAEDRPRFDEFLKYHSISEK